MIDMIEAIKKYDPESVSLISKQYVNPLCRNYLSTVSL